MSSFLIALVLSAAPADGAAESKKPEPAKAEAQRGYHEISKDMHEIMKREALAKSKPERVEALIELCDLYREVAGDTRLEISESLKEYKGVIRARLNRSKNDIKAHLAREKKKAPKNKKPAEVQSEVLAEQAQTASQSLADQLSLASSTLGGPGQVFAAGAASQSQAGAFGGGMRDYSQDLIDLIERTIAPASWETNGGNGAIVYYPGLMALVVSATTEVHGEVNTVLENLREAGR